ncbi:MAG: oligonucleotide/oligosaccharide-binding-fold domain-containing protein, partial [Pseudomonadales bacterium]|nr:oligonucleotide/oligosaccharide-binding-fold domain-containing protein [Pseudomonadales bacterium]
MRCLRSADSAREQLKAIMERLEIPMVSSEFEEPEYYSNIRECLASGFFMQVAHLEKSGHYVSVKDNQVMVIHPSSVLGHKPEWMLYNEVVLTTKNYVRTVTQVQGEWLLQIAPTFFDLDRLPPSEARSALERIKLRPCTPTDLSRASAARAFSDVYNTYLHRWGDAALTAVTLAAEQANKTLRYARSTLSSSHASPALPNMPKVLVEFVAKTEASRFGAVREDECVMPPDDTLVSIRKEPTAFAFAVCYAYEAQPGVCRIHYCPTKPQTPADPLELFCTMSCQTAYLKDHSRMALDNIRPRWVTGQGERGSIMNPSGQSPVVYRHFKPPRNAISMEADNSLKRTSLSLACQKADLEWKYGYPRHKECWDFYDHCQTADPDNAGIPLVWLQEYRSDDPVKARYIWQDRRLQGLNQQGVQLHDLREFLNQQNRYGYVCRGKHPFEGCELFAIRPQWIDKSPRDHPFEGDPWAVFSDIPIYKCISFNYSFLSGPLTHFNQTKVEVWIPEPKPIDNDPNPAESARSSTVTMPIALAHWLDADRKKYYTGRHFIPHGNSVCAAEQAQPGKFGCENSLIIDPKLGDYVRDGWGTATVPGTFPTGRTPVNLAFANRRSTDTQRRAEDELSEELAHRMKMADLLHDLDSAGHLRIRIAQDCKNFVRSRI